MSDIIINSCYFHSIIHGCDKSLEVMDSILKMGYIKSPKSLGVKARSGCHKESEICLSKVTPSKNKKEIFSCFELYLPKLTSFVIDKSVSSHQKIIKTKCVPTTELHKHTEGTVTNLYDEYRTREDISLDYIKGICIPYNNLVNDPFQFLQFVNEEILMAYYNGLLDYYLIEEIKREQSDIIFKNSRIELLELYIKKLEVLLHEYDRRIPIYHYNIDAGKKCLIKR